MKSFEYYLENGDVQKITPNTTRAKALVNDAFSRLNDLKSINMKKLSKLFFEYTYDALRDFVDSILILDGYKSYSHEAPIAYLSKKGFDVVVVKQWDDFRYKRNGSKYYGQNISSEDAKSILDFYNKIKSKLDKIFEGLI